MDYQETPGNEERSPSLPEESPRAESKGGSASATYTIIGLNVLVYLAMVIRGVSWIAPTAYNLLAWGADYGPRTLDGQCWRMFVSLFLHYGIIHLAFNMWVLANIGPFIESLSRRISYVLLYIVAGLGGGAASLVWHPTTVGAGASGAIFGLYGALLAFLLRHRRVIAPQALKSLSKGALVFIGYNVLFGLARPEIDMAAHLGGLVTGFLLGLFLVQPSSLASSSSKGRNAAAVAFGAALVILTLLAVPRPDDFLGEFRRFADTEGKSLALFNTLTEKWKAHQLTDAQYADIVDQQILPKWKAEHDAMAKLQHLPANQKKLTSALIKYMDAREESWQLLFAGMRAADGQKVRQSIEKNREADELAGKIGASQK